MSSLSLYEITAELVPLEQALEAVGGDVEQVEGALVERVTDLLGQVQAKVDAYGQYYKALEAMAAAHKMEESRLAERRAVIENKMKRLKDAAKKSLELRSIKKVEGLTFTIAVQSNGGKAPLKILVKDARELPTIYQKIKVEPDEEAIRAGIEAKDPQLVGKAELLPVGAHVRIR